MGILGLLRQRWDKHNRRLMKKTLYDASIGGGLPLHREQEFNERAVSREMGYRVPVMPLDAGLDVSGNVKPD
jgi:hypothetical protein